MVVRASQNNLGWTGLQQVLLRKGSAMWSDQVAEGFSQPGLENFQLRRLHSFTGPLLHPLWVKRFLLVFSLNRSPHPVSMYAHYPPPSCNPPLQTTLVLLSWQPPHRRWGAAVGSCTPEGMPLQAKSSSLSPIKKCSRPWPSWWSVAKRAASHLHFSFIGGGEEQKPDAVFKCI